MDKQPAISIIKNTFENPFDKEKFVCFIKNLLNRVEEASFSYQGQFIPDAYKGYISSLERIGKFKDGENRIDILIIKLQKETSLERARTMQRNFVAGYLQGKYGSSNEKEAALVAFVSPDEEDWRFSLVKMDYKFEQTQTGRIKVKEEYTPARRWSFLVGKNETSHTAQSRLVDILANDEYSPTLKKLEQAFDIETVTKEFFIKYRELFIRTKEELDKVVKNDAKIKADFGAKGVNTVDFAKKLLGQIVFLYFLQKKGWFGVDRDAKWGTGSKHFLRELFEKRHGSYKNLFNDILEPLFYDALSRDRSDIDHWNDQFKCKIPFLNGGLFDPIGNNGGYNWVHTDICLPDSLFSNKNKTKEGDEGDGILDIFDRYNFTVREDEPLEKEVAIDPELLGKAYEKFNAIRHDNFEEYKKALKSGKKGEESKFNKQYGVYYTPREIVHYMCQQSLINYLYTQLNSGIVVYEKLDEKQLYMFGNEGEKGQLDLMIEHGSKPIISKEDIETLIHLGEQVGENEARVESKGKETKTYSYKLPESIRKNASLIDQKLADIAVCDPAVGSGAFPVGMMSEIVKARNVLSTFIKEKNLTTYDFKHQCIEKSLYGVDIDPGAVEIAKLRLWLSLVVDEDDIKNIKPLPNLDYKIVCGNSLLGVEKNLFNNHLFSELEKIKPLYFNETNPTKKQDYKKQIDELISQITNGHKEFDFEIYFSEVFHHKGGFDVVIANPPYLNFKMYSSVERKKLSLLYEEIFDGKADYYYYFFNKAYLITNKNGFVCLITSRYWIEAEFATKLRTFLSQKITMNELIDFKNATVFEGLGIKTAITSFKKTNALKNYFFNYRYSPNKMSEPDLLSLKLTQVKSENISKDKWQIGGESHINVIETIEKNAVLLGSLANCNQGIVTGLDKAFVTINNEFQNLPDFLVKKWIKVGDIHKYYILPVEKRELVYTNLITDIDDYPELKSRLLPFKPKLSNRREAKSGKIRWFDLQWGRDTKLFDAEKLICRFKADKNTFCYDNEKCYSSADTTIVTLNENGKDLVSIKYLLALLNSKLLDFYFKSYGKLMDYRYEYYPKSVSLMRINICKQQGPFIKIVDEILSLTQSDDYLQNPDKQAKVKEYERQIDQLVYKLYDLTPEEIEIVEGKK